MREIKFRIWDKEQKKFKIKDENIVAGDIKSCLSEIVDFDENSIQINGNERFKLLQYTGFKDKNDIEIYEGDIVKGKWEEVGCEETGIKEVKFEDGCIEPFTELTGTSSGYYKDDTFRCRSYEFEVIGNRYENQELLNKIKNGSTL